MVRNNQAIILFNENRCQCITQKNTQCKFKAQLIFDGLFKCGKHIPKQIQNKQVEIDDEDDCAICFHPLHL